VRWLFVGGGAGLAQLRREVERRGLRSVTFQPYQPRERLADSLAVPDVHLVSLLPEFEGLIVPSKFYGVAAAGRPTIFIGDGRGEIAELIARHRCGHSIGAGDGTGLAQAVAAMACDEAATLAMGAAARAAFERVFDRPFAISSWHEVLDLVAAERRAVPALARTPQTPVAGE
jgi:hypothetical protein